MNNGDYLLMLLGIVASLVVGMGGRRAGGWRALLFLLGFAVGLLYWNRTTRHGYAAHDVGTPE